MRKSWLPLLATVGAWLLGCEEPADDRAYSAVVIVHSDPGKPVEGATVQQAGKTIATSDSAGLARVELRGQEGESVDLTLRCPNGFEAPKKGITVRLSRSGDAQRMPEYAAACAPSLRQVVVAIRADNGPNVPVTYLGRTITKTDAGGTAHVLMRMRPGDQFELGLDTTGLTKHRPQNPKASFLVPTNGDDVMRFDVRFEVERPKPIARAVRAKPTRL